MAAEVGAEDKRARDDASHPIGMAAVAHLIEQVGEQFVAIRRNDPDLVAASPQIPGVGSPPQLGLPFTTWTVRRLNAYCQRKKLLPPFSDEWVRVLLRRARLSAQRIRTWKHSDDPRFGPKGGASAPSSAAAPPRAAVVSFDEWGPLERRPIGGRTTTEGSWMNPIEPHFGVLGRATYAGSDDPAHVVRRQRVYRYLRLRHRTLGNAAHPLTRIRSIKPVKIEGFADRPDLPLVDRLAIARMARRYAQDSGSVQRELIARADARPRRASALLRAFTENATEGRDRVRRRAL